MAQIAAINARRDAEIAEVVAAELAKHRPADHRPALSTSELAIALGITEEAARRMCAEREIPCAQIRGKYRVAAATVDHLLSGQPAA
jgi:excisionase family DNA binding protein